VFVQTQLTIDNEPPDAAKGGRSIDCIDDISAWR
jgi:hypothetical protein